MQYNGLKVYHVDGETDQKYGSRSKRRNLIPSYCEYCGYDKFVTRHRIKPGSEKGKYLPGNVIGLCPNCHWEADNSLIPRAILFQIVQERLRYQHGQTQATV